MKFSREQMLADSTTYNHRRKIFEVYSTREYNLERKFWEEHNSANGEDEQLKRRSGFDYCQILRSMQKRNLRQSTRFQYHIWNMTHNRISRIPEYHVTSPGSTIHPHVQISSLSILYSTPFHQFSVSTVVNRGI